MRSVSYVLNDRPTIETESCLIPKPVWNMFAECYDVAGKHCLPKITALHIHKLWKESKLMRVNTGGHKLIAAGSNEEKN